MTQVRRSRGEVRGARFAILLLLLAAGIAAPAAAQTREAIRYTLRFPAPQTDYVEVEAVDHTDGGAWIDMMMAVWTPGSYLIREYERNVEAVKAMAGTAVLRSDKTAKNRWRITTGGSRDVTVTYRVYSHEMTVRSNWVDADFAMLNGAPTYLTLVESGARPPHGRPQLPPARETPVPRMPRAPRRAPDPHPPPTPP